MKSYTVQTMKIWIFVVILLGSLVLFFCSIPVLSDLNIPFAIILIWGAACLAGGYYLTKKVAVVTMQVTLTPELLTIRSAQTGSEQQIPMTDISSFLYEDFNGNKTFRLRLQSGKKVRLAHNDTFCPADDIEALTADFEAQVAGTNFSVHNAERPAITREKGFFEKPLANVLGWGIVAALVYTTYYLQQHGVKDGKWSSVFMIYGNGLTYLGTWLAARRKNPEDQ